METNLENQSSVLLIPRLPTLPACAAGVPTLLSQVEELQLDLCGACQVMLEIPLPQKSYQRWNERLRERRCCYVNRMQRIALTLTVSRNVITKSRQPRLFVYFGEQFWGNQSPPPLHPEFHSHWKSKCVSIVLLVVRDGSCDITNTIVYEYLGSSV